MLKRTGTLAAAVLALAACSGSSPTGPTAGLARGDLAPSFVLHNKPGTPGDANCRGETAAFLAQGARLSGLRDFHGVGGNARENGDLTVQELQALIKAFCAGP